MPDKCRFWDFCNKVYHYECEETNPSMATCDNFWFAELVHNHAIEKIVAMIDDPMDNEWRMLKAECEALRLPQHLEEGK